MQALKAEKGQQGREKKIRARRTIPLDEMKTVSIRLPGPEDSQVGNREKSFAKKKQGKGRLLGRGSSVRRQGRTREKEITKNSEENAVGFRKGRQFHRKSIFPKRLRINHKEEKSSGRTPMRRSCGGRQGKQWLLEKVHAHPRGGTKGDYVTKTVSQLRKEEQKNEISPRNS